jgi:hypothetical protein
VYKRKHFYFVDIAVFSTRVLDKEIISMKVKFSQFRVIMAEQFWQAQQCYHTIRHVDSVQEMPS